MTTYATEVEAAVLRTIGSPMAFETIRLRQPQADEVRISIDATGVCHSDLSLASGALDQLLPAVLGHEACGTVVEVGSDVRTLRLGDRVVPLWLAPCGECFFCRSKEPHLCERAGGVPPIPCAVDRSGTPISAGLTVGSFAEQVIMRESALVRVPDDIASSHAALLGCAVATGVGAVVRTAAMEPGSSVAVIGLGGVGLSAIQGARIMGAETIIAIDRNVDKAEWAARAGAGHFVAADDALRRSVRELTDGRGVDYAFDCVGSAPTIREAWQLTRRGGTACIVGIGRKDDRVDFGALELFHFARTLKGCVAGSLDPREDFDRLFDWLRSGQLDLDLLITGRAGLDGVDVALAELRDGSGIRTLLSPGNRGAGSP